MPARQIVVDPGRHFARRALLGQAALRSEGAMAERAQRAVQCDAAVEIGAGDVDAVVRKNVVNYRVKNKELAVLSVWHAHRGRGARV